jgi:purine-binding chemotaxis protein CheW
MSESLSFAVADRRIDLPAESVRKIARLPTLSALPGAAPSVLGVANIDGGVVAVVSARGLLGLAEAENADDPLVVVVERGRRRIGLLVDRPIEAGDAGGEPFDLERLVAGLGGAR